MVPDQETRINTLKRSKCIHRTTDLAVLGIASDGDLNAVMCTHDDRWDCKKQEEDEERFERPCNFRVSLHLLHCQLSMDVPCFGQHVPAKSTKQSMSDGQNLTNQTTKYEKQRSDLAEIPIGTVWGERLWLRYLD